MAFVAADSHRLALRLRCSPSVGATLRAAAQLQSLPADVRADAARCAKGEDVPWQLLHRACKALREAGTADADADAASAPWLQSLARSGGLQLPQPECRKRSVELDKRVRLLRIQADERAYQSLVHDITRKEREERERVPMSSSMREIGFGVHVLTVMGSCFLAGYALGRRIFSNPGAQVAVGALCMLASLLVETALFVIQDSRQQAGEAEHAATAKQTPPQKTLK